MHTYDIFKSGLQNDFELLRILNYWSLNYRGSTVFYFLAATIKYTSITIRPWFTKHSGQRYHISSYHMYVLNAHLLFLFLVTMAVVSPCLNIQFLLSHSLPVSFCLPLPHSDTEIQNLLKSVRSDIQDGCHLLPNRKSDWAKSWWEASQQHRDSELLKSFLSDIQDGRHSGHLEILQVTSPSKP